MGRLNKKLTLKNKKAAKAVSKAVASEKEPVAEAKVPSKLLLDLPATTLSVTSKTNEKPSTVVPTKLSKITKKEKRKIKSDGLKNKLTHLAKQKIEAKGLFCISYNTELLTSVFTLGFHLYLQYFPLKL
jgi:hypothetical protein